MSSAMSIDSQIDCSPLALCSNIRVHASEGESETTVGPALNLQLANYYELSDVDRDSSYSDGPERALVLYRQTVNDTFERDSRLCDAEDMLVIDSSLPQTMHSQYDLGSGFGPSPMDCQRLRSDRDSCGATMDEDWFKHAGEQIFSAWYEDAQVLLAIWLQEFWVEYFAQRRAEIAQKDHTIRQFEELLLQAVANTSPAPVDDSRNLREVMIAGFLGALLAFVLIIAGRALYIEC